MFIGLLGRHKDQLARAFLDLALNHPAPGQRRPVVSDDLFLRTHHGPRHDARLLAFVVCESSAVAEGHCFETISSEGYHCIATTKTSARMTRVVSSSNMVAAHRKG